MSTNVTLEVDRADCGETRLVEVALDELGEDQVRLRVDRFALTANNVTYAVLGDMLGYWDFFPVDPAAGDDDGRPGVGCRPWGGPTWSSPPTRMSPPAAATTAGSRWPDTSI